MQINRAILWNYNESHIFTGEIVLREYVWCLQYLRSVNIDLVNLHLPFTKPLVVYQRYIMRVCLLALIRTFTGREAQTQRSANMNQSHEMSVTTSLPDEGQFTQQYMSRMMSVL